MNEELLKIIEAMEAANEPAEVIAAVVQRYMAEQTTPKSENNKPTSAEQEDIEVSEKNAIVDNNYWNSNEQGSVGQLFQSMGVTRDDIAVDENGNYTIGGESEITVPTKWALEHMGLPINYEDAGSSSMSVNDFFSEYGVDKVWKEEEATLNTLNSNKERSSTLDGVISDSEKRNADIWVSLSEKGLTRDSYEERNDGIYYKEYVEFPTKTRADGSTYLSANPGYNYTKVGTKYKDGSIRLTSPAYSEHALAIEAFNNDVKINNATEKRDKNKNKAAKSSGSKNMPVVSDSDLDRDDSNLNKWMEKYGRFGFKFSASATEGDFVTIEADNGDKIKVGVSGNAGTHTPEEVDKWMRDRAVDKGSVLAASLEDALATAEESEQVRINSVERYNSLVTSTTEVVDTQNKDRSDEFTTVGSVYNFMVEAKKLTDLMESGKGSLRSIDAAVEIASGETVGDEAMITIPKEWEPKKGSGVARGLVFGPSKELEVAMQSAKNIAKRDFLNNYVKEDGSKLTPEEKANFFTENSVVSVEERTEAINSILETASNIRWDDPRLRNEVVNTFEMEGKADIMRQNIADSVESLSNKIFDKEEMQEALVEDVEAEKTRLNKEQTYGITELNIFNSQ